MISQTAVVTAALIANSTVKGIINTNIFCDEPPDEADHPCLTYEEFLTPAAFADNTEMAYAVEWNMESRVKKNAWPLADAVEVVMKSLGYVCEFKKSAGMSGVIHQVSMKFTMVKEV